ncbi:hypothetical protein EJ07DRAFT_160676 [Lizonia empirigonia]|nr:hypothetical protein EJ07DRAFT_160676 [Lizonia empirigonia]
MTTGRINQVTIVNPSAEANERTPPKGAGMYQVEGRSLSDPQPQASKMCETPKPRATDSIAPLSSPSCGPRQVALGYYTAYYPVTYALRRRRLEPSQRASAGLLVRYRGRSPTSGSHRPEDSPEGRKTRQVAAKAARMLTTPAEAVVVEPSRFAVRLTCSSHISSQQVGGRFSRRGVRAAEKISELISKALSQVRRNKTSTKLL